MPRRRQAGLEPTLQDPEFQSLPVDVVAAARSYAAYRIEMGLQPLVKATWRVKLQCARANPETFIAEVAQTIGRGWEGIYPVEKAPPWKKKEASREGDPRYRPASDVLREAGYTEKELKARRGQE